MPTTALQVLSSPAFSKISWLVHGFSTRLGGWSQCYGGSDLNLGFTKHDSRPTVGRNRAAFLAAIGAHAQNGDYWPLITLKQVHSDQIQCVDKIPEHPLTGDGMVTNTPGLLLAVQTADCLPVLLVDTENHAVGAFHAGWRGTVARIVEKGVGEMRKQFGSAPRHLRASIGPGVHACCYEVGEEVREKFQSQFSYAGELFEEVFASDPVREKYPLLFMNARAPGHGDLGPKLHLDLVKANRRQLIDAGVPEKHIDAAAECTVCRKDLLFSYRAEKGMTGRLMGVVGIRP